MSTVTINRVGMDQVVVEFVQTGSHELSTSIKDELLDANKNYVFCVDSLNVPLDRVPIQPDVGIPLFTIFKRNVGQNIDAGVPNRILNISPPGGLQNACVLAGKHFDVCSAVEEINSFCRGFERYYTENGLLNFSVYGQAAGQVNANPPILPMPAKNAQQIEDTGLYKLLRFEVASDGSAVLIGTSNFWNNFFLSFSRRGGELLGLSDKLVTYLLNAGGGGANPVTLHGLSYTAKAGVITPNLLITNVGVIREAPLNRTVQVYSSTSLFTTLDARVKVELESHLPIENNMLIRDEKEQVDRNIAEVFFQNEAIASFEFDSAGTITSKKIATKVYCGLYPLIKKSSPNKTYHKLLTSYNLRYFRFHLYVTFRTYDSVTDLWKFSRKALDVPKNLFWSCSLRFCSEV